MSKPKPTDWIDPRNVKPNTAGALFLIGPIDEGADAEPLPGAPMYKTVFMRVRVVMGQVHVADVKQVADFVAYLRSHRVPFITFSAGRDTPYPEYPEDLGEALATSPRLPSQGVSDFIDIATRLKKKH